MSTRRSSLSSVIAAVLTLAAIHEHAAAQEDAEQVAADQEDAEVATPEVATSQDAAAAPDGMVFDPTTGRYMPVGVQLPWRNSFFIFDNSLNHTTFDNSTLSDTDYWIQTYSLRPRWNFDDTLSLRFRQDIYAELVASTTTSEHQPVVLDTQIDLVDAAILNLEGVLIGVGGRVLLPMSQISRNANRVLGTGATASATKVFGEVLDGLVTQLAGSYQRWWATSTAPTGYAPAADCIADSTVTRCNNFPTNTSVRDQFAASMFGQLQFTPELSVGASFTWLWMRGAGLGAVDTGALGPGIDGEILDDNSKTHWRNLTLSSLWLAYQVNTWLQASLGMNTFTPQLNPNGSVRNPLWNPDTQYSLTAVVTIDQLYAAIVTPAETPPTTAKRGRRTPL